MRAIRRVVGLVALGALLAPACAWNPDVARPVALNAAAQSSKIFAADGSLVTTLHAEENRETVPLDNIAPTLRDAVVAIEDRRFWEHGGVDLRSLLRAAYSNTSKGEIVEGGSTITQQYVKNSLLDPQRTLHRKIREASLAYQLERHYTKAQILEGYLNTIYFGNGAYGAQAASSVYFGTTAEKLTLAQSALLAALIRSPRSYDPYRAPAAARSRRNLVLSELVAQGKVTRELADAAKAEPVGVVTQPLQARYPAGHFVEEVKQLLLDNRAFGRTAAERQAALFTGGLRVYTTLDPARQSEAEQAVGRVLSQPATDPEGALVSLDPRTGYVRALVGGRDFFGNTPTAKFDLATQHGRPAGSSFKPLVLTAALLQGIPLSKTYSAPSHLTIPLPPPQQPWDVSNYEDEAFGGRLDLVEATVHSINTVYAQLILDVGPSRAVDVAKRMGVRSTLNPYPSAVLGTNDVTPLDMASAYATLANRGVHVDPVFVTKVTKADGTVLYQHHRTTQRVIPREVADTVTSVLQQVVLRGTGVRANIGRPVAGKTGTGQEWRDAWFVGYTPDLTTAVWVGFPQAQISMVPPRTRIKVVGGTWPAEIWQQYMSAALAEVPASDFVAPAPPPGPTTSTTAPAPAPAGTPVPNVVGLQFRDAAARLKSAGFLAVEHDVANRDYPPGYVVAQTPRPGGLAAAGSDVILDVSAGTSRITTVPDVLGLTEAQARSSIERAGLVADVTVQAESGDRAAKARKGRVWGQSPTGGDRRQVGDSVHIWVNP